MVKVELVSKKVPRSLNDRLKRLQARYQLKHRKRISEGRIIEVAIEHLEEHEEELERPAAIQRNKKLTDIIGIFKGGPKTNAEEELDDVVYGKVGKT